MDEYEILDVIGHGSFGHIRRVRRKKDGMILCRKEISYYRMSPKEKEQLSAEFNILSKLNHINIVRYYHREHIRQDSAIHIYMEYCGNGDLSQVIKKCKKEGTLVPEDLVWSIFSQLVCALYRCHYGRDPPIQRDVFVREKNSPPPPLPSIVILHRDLKPENVFLDHENAVKLGDFGLSKLLSPGQVLATTYVGTPFYMSPEIVTDRPYTLRSDIWALGCVIYELCSLSPPFTAKNHLALAQKIKEGKFPPLPKQYSTELQRVVQSCLILDPGSRPDTSTLLHVSAIRLALREKDIMEFGRSLKIRHEALRQRELEMTTKEQDLMRAWEAGIAEQVNQEVMRRLNEVAASQIERLVETELESIIQRRLHDERIAMEERIEQRRLRSSPSRSSLRLHGSPSLHSMMSSSPGDISMSTPASCPREPLGYLGNSRPSEVRAHTKSVPPTEAHPPPTPTRPARMSQPIRISPSRRQTVSTLGSPGRIPAAKSDTNLMQRATKKNHLLEVATRRQQQLEEGFSWADEHDLPSPYLKR